MKKSTFIITSAINTKTGVFNPITRALQTIKTIESVKKFYPNSLTILVDGGNKSILDESYNIFAQLRNSVDCFFDCSTFDEMSSLHKSINQLNNPYEMGGVLGLSKSVAELYILYNTFNTILNESDMKTFKDVDRIFKISGRYELSPLHNPYQHFDEIDKYVFKDKEVSWIPNIKDIHNIEYFNSSRFWSFDSNLLENTFNSFHNMLEYVQSMNNLYIDMEHLLFKFIDIKNVKTLKYTHCYGSIAPNGTLVYD